MTMINSLKELQIAHYGNWCAVGDGSLVCRFCGCIQEFEFSNYDESHYESSDCPRVDFLHTYTSKYHDRRRGEKLVFCGYVKVVSGDVRWVQTYFEDDNRFDHDDSSYGGSWLDFGDK